MWDAAQSEPGNDQYANALGRTRGVYGDAGILGLWHAREADDHDLEGTRRSLALQAVVQELTESGEWLCHKSAGTIVVQIRGQSINVHPINELSYHTSPEGNRLVKASHDREERISND